MLMGRDKGGEMPSKYQGELVEGRRQLLGDQVRRKSRGLLQGYCSFRVSSTAAGVRVQSKLGSCVGLHENPGVSVFAKVLESQAG